MEARPLNFPSVDSNPVLESLPSQGNTSTTTSQNVAAAAVAAAASNSFGYYDERGNYIQPSTRLIHQGYDQYGRPIMVEYDSLRYSLPSTGSTSVLLPSNSSSATSATNTTTTAGNPTTVSAANLASLAVNTATLQQQHKAILNSALMAAAASRNAGAGSDKSTPGGINTVGVTTGHRPILSNPVNGRIPIFTADGKAIDTALEMRLLDKNLDLTGLSSLRRFREDELKEGRYNGKLAPDEGTRLELERKEEERRERKRRRIDNARPFDDPDDVINSDLDDTEDEQEKEDEGEDEGNLVLCLYEKVSRSKNKWKCVLRDGVMTINGKDYLFQRASGDFEW